MYNTEESENETCCQENGLDWLPDQSQTKLMPESKPVLLTAVYTVIVYLPTLTHCA